MRKVRTLSQRYIPVHILAYVLQMTKDRAYKVTELTKLSMKKEH